MNETVKAEPRFRPVFGEHGEYLPLLHCASCGRATRHNNDKPTEGLARCRVCGDVRRFGMRADDAERVFRSLLDYDEGDR